MKPDNSEIYCKVCGAPITNYEDVNYKGACWRCYKENGVIY